MKNQCNDARFIAIPVTQGDAFYLQRGNFSLLVDGGRSQTALPSLFGTATKTKGVNVLVCTHNDADHAKGILGFLEAGLPCDEVWLPGRWLGALPDVLKPFVEVFAELASDLAAEKNELLSKLGGPESDLSPIEAYAECVLEESENNVITPVEGPALNEDGWPESYLQALEQADPWERLPHWDGSGGSKVLSLQRVYIYCLGLFDIRPKDFCLLWSAIDAADRIRSIAMVAFHRGIPVRWFEFDPEKPSGGKPELQPINSRAVATVRPRTGRLLRWLALTVANKESLVFWSPPAAEYYPGVLFTADSDLRNVPLPSQFDNAIVTAPHHGSETNSSAYQAVSTAASNSSTITWVRSDGRYKKRPGTTYLKQASRLCTLCRTNGGGSATKQAVHLFSHAGVWMPHTSTRKCSC